MTIMLKKNMIIMKNVQKKIKNPLFKNLRKI